ncbi:MAG: hypothetical protein ACQES5_06600 [Thermodesulfobacteriota bacterium]|mgnify:CR=1 FL=1
MALLSAERLRIHPPMDLEMYMILAQVKGLEGRETVELIPLWERLSSGLAVYRLGEKKGYAAAYLNKEIEDELEKAWEESPSKGFKKQALAQTLIMGALRQLLPELDKHQCAPVPKPNKLLKRSLAKIGLEFSNAGTLNYKYSTLTFCPFRGGCELCYLAESCPKYNPPNLKGLFSSNSEGRDAG